MEFPLGPLNIIGLILQSILLGATWITTKRVVENTNTKPADAFRLSFYLLITIFYSINVIFSAVKLELSMLEASELWRLRLNCIVPLVTLIVILRVLALLLFRFPLMKLGVFIAGSAGCIFYLGTAIVLLIYCDSSIVFDMISVAFTFAMNVQCFICQDDSFMELDRIALGEGVLGFIAAIVSYFSRGFQYQNILVIKILWRTTGFFKLLDVVLQLTCASSRSASVLVNYFRSRLKEAFE